MIEHTEELEVPKNSGIEGFLATIKAILKLPAVQRVVIEPNKIVLTRLIDPNKSNVPVELDFEGLLPYSVLRNCERIREIAPRDSVYSTLVAVMMAASKDRLYPVAFATGADTALLKWYENGTGDELDDEAPLLGIPVYRDRQIEDTHLYLCAARSRGGALVDTVRAYKVQLPEGT